MFIPWVRFHYWCYKYSGQGQLNRYAEIVLVPGVTLTVYPWFHPLRDQWHKQCLATKIELEIVKDKFQDSKHYHPSKRLFHWMKRHDFTPHRYWLAYPYHTKDIEGKTEIINWNIPGRSFKKVG